MTNDYYDPESGYIIAPTDREGFVVPSWSNYDSRPDVIEQMRRLQEQRWSELGNAIHRDIEIGYQPEIQQEPYLEIEYINRYVPPPSENRWGSEEAIERAIRTIQPRQLINSQTEPLAQREDSNVTTTRIRQRASMTRQHFEAIAAAVRTIEGVNIRQEIVDALGPVMERFNSSFQMDRFSEACGVTRRRPNTQTVRLPRIYTISDQLGDSVPEPRTQRPQRYPVTAVGGRWIYVGTDTRVPRHVSVLGHGATGYYVETAPPRESTEVVLQEGINPSTTFYWAAHYISTGEHAGRWTYNSGHLIPLEASIRHSEDGNGYRTNVYSLVGLNVGTSHIESDSIRPSIEYARHSQYAVEAVNATTYRYRDWAGEVSTNLVHYGPYMRRRTSASRLNHLEPSEGFYTDQMPGGIDELGE